MPNWFYILPKVIFEKSILFFTVVENCIKPKLICKMKWILSVAKKLSKGQS